MKPMIFIISILLSVNVFAGPMTKLVTESQVDTYLKNGKFNGVVLVARDKKILLKKAYGVRDLLSRQLLSVDDKFQIGSVSKQFIAVALLKLQEEGRLSLTDKVTKYLPEYVEFNNIEIKDLLNHTSGIANYTDQVEFWKSVNYNRILSMDEILDFIRPYKLEFEAKSQWNYSNTNYIIAGKILEVVSQQSWDQFISQNFLIPMNMIDTGYVEFFESVSKVEGHIGTNSLRGEMNLSWASSAGGLYSTVDDLLKWTSIYDDSSLLTKKSKEQMQTPFLENYGLGITIGQLNNEVLINHSGRTPGFVTDLTYLKTSKLKVVTLDNMDGQNVNASSVLLQYFSTGEALVVKNNPYFVPEEKLKDYVGTYEGKNLSLVITLDNNKLYLQPSGQRSYLLTPNDLDSFKLENISGEEFIRNEDGLVVGLKHYQVGVSEFKKVSEKNKIKSVIQSKKQPFYIF